MDDLADLLDRDRVLVAGVGGGGDVVGTVPTAQLLEAHGVEPVVAGLAWERVPHDPHPGPRPVDDLEAVEPVAPGVVRATAGTRTSDGVTFAETAAAQHLPWTVLLLDAHRGPAALGEGLAEAADTLGLDRAVALDAGGDALARGDEDGLQSPLADATTLAALDRLDLARTVGVLGWGSDGELDREELRAAYRRAVGSTGLLGAWGVTPAAARRMDPLLEAVPTEASRIPVEAARGQVGPRSIRDGRRTVDVGPDATVTYYLPWAPVLDQSDTVDLVRDASSIEAAHEALREAGHRTELAYERAWAEDREP
jgi:hypothetical protein